MASYGAERSVRELHLRMERLRARAARRTSTILIPRPGLAVTADLEGDHYVLNGRKYWPSNSGGWDLKGADINVVVARTDRFAGGKEGLSCIIVPRGTAGVTYGQPLDKMGQRVNQNNDMVLDNVHVPAENAFAIGNADLAINRDFTWSGPIAGVAAVGTARAAYEYVLNWSPRPIQRVAPIRSSTIRSLATRWSIARCDSRRRGI